MFILEGFSFIYSEGGYSASNYGTDLLKNYLKRKIREKNLNFFNFIKI